MYHRHDTSRYVTMYLDPFKTAMHYIPGVFHASQNYGYQIPDDLEKLIDFLSDGLLTIEQHKQQELKNQLFVKRMQRTVKKLQSDHHDGCHGTKCFKVSLFGDEYLSNPFYGDSLVLFFRRWINEGGFKRANNLVSAQPPQLFLPVFDSYPLIALVLENTLVVSDYKNG